MSNLATWPMVGAFAVLSFASGAVKAYEPDGPFLAHQARNAATWQVEDRSVDEKLAALEQRFGKKPNIVYILTDDIGWGELGWQGGGKHRGTPSPSLDRMASVRM